MSQVFISYRRADSHDWADRLNRQLSMRYGKDLVFQDVDDIGPGCNWLETIRQELVSCQAFLIVIGPRWLTDAAGRRRLDDPKDVLRMEVAEALSSKGTVIPVLVGGSAMPSSDDLPEPLRPLALRQAVRLSDEKWFPEVEALIEQLRVMIWPAEGQISLAEANQELCEKQVRYFALLDNESAADALDLAQRTQAYLDRVLPLYPQDPDLKVTRGYLFKNEGMAMLGLRRHREAESALNKAESIFRTMIEERPRDAGAWNGLGSVEAVRGNFEKAHEYVDQALQILPGYPAAREDHAQILARLGRTTCKVMKGRGRGAGSSKKARRNDSRQGAP